MPLENRPQNAAEPPGDSAEASGVSASARRSAVAAARWAFAGGALSRLLGMFGLFLVARLISREAYGAFREVAALHAVAAVLMPLGIDQLLIRESAARDRFARALSGALMTAAAVLALAALALQPWMAAWMGLGKGGILWLLPLVLAAQALKLSAKPVLAARLDFRRIAAGEAIQVVVALFGGALALLAWPGAEALYIAFAAGELAEWRWLRAAAPPSSRAGWRDNVAAFRSALREHRRFCSLATVDQLFCALSASAPALFLGALLGSSAVGDYAMANALVAVPALFLIGVVGRVAYPALAGRGEADLRAKSLLALRASAAAVPPALIWLSIFAAPAVWLALGEKWVAPCAPLLRWLALYLAFTALFSPISPLDYLRDRPDLSLAYNLASFLARLAGLAWGGRHSLEAAVAGYSIGASAVWLGYSFVLAWLMRCPAGRFHGAWLRFAPLWMALGLALWAVRRGFGESPWLGLAASAAPLAAYALAAAAMDREARDLGLRALGLKGMRPKQPEQRPDEIKGRGGK